MIDKDKMTLFVTGMFLLLIMTTGLSYAYFSASVKGNENAKDMVVEAGTLSLVYTDGPEIKVQNIKPGWSTTKEVLVKNNGTLEANYNIIWQSLTNEVANNEMVISATCQRLNASGTVEGTCESISQAAISDMTIAKKISIESGITHKYTFTILFKETNADQNYNQGKEFNGVLGIEEYKAPDFATDSWSTIIANVKAGYGSDYAVGSTKEVNLGTTYGTHTLRVANTSTPSEIKNAIIDTTVVSGHGSTSGETNFTSTDKLYLLSTAEVWAQGSSNTISDDAAIDVTRQLDYYKNLVETPSNYNGAIKKKGTSASAWWLRTATSNTNNYFYIVDKDGHRNTYIADYTRSVAPAFRLG